MKRVLFVCHGNICRSPMAEFYFKDLVKKAGLEHEYEIASAATSTEEIGNPVYPNTRDLLASLGISCKGKTARQMTRKDYDYYDYIVAMDSENLWGLKRIVREDVEGKISLLLDHTSPDNKAYHNRDVADPWYTRDFNATFRDVEVGCKALLEKTRNE